MRTTIKKIEKQGLTKEEIMTLANVDEERYVKYRKQARGIFISALELDTLNTIRTNDRTKVLKKARMFDEIFNEEQKKISILDKANIIDELPMFLEQIEQQRINREVKAQQDRINEYKSAITRLQEQIGLCEDKITTLQQKSVVEQLNQPTLEETTEPKTHVQELHVTQIFKNGKGLQATIPKTSPIKEKDFVIIPSLNNSKWLVFRKYTNGTGTLHLVEE